MRFDVKQIKIIKATKNKPAIIHAEFADRKIREWYVTENGVRAFWTLIRFRYSDWWEKNKIGKEHTIQDIIDKINATAREQEEHR